MKKLVLIPLFSMFFVSFLSADSWECSSDTECPEGTSCHSSSKICVMDKDRVAESATIRLAIGENSPSSLGSDKIFVANPSNDLVLGQLAVTGSGSGQIYFIKELSADLLVYPKSIDFDDFKLVYDANGNGAEDPSEKVLAKGVPADSGMKFEIAQKYQAFKMNQAENFLIIGSFSTDKEMNDIARFNVTVKSEYIKTKTYTGEGDVESTSPIVFPSFAFEPEKGYFLISSGKNFPKAPTSWKEINKEQEIMHLRLKALDGANELLALRIELYGTTVSFGNGVEKISICTDPNGSGKCGEVIAELSDFAEPQQSVSIQIPSGKIALAEGEEKYLVVKADLNFYKDQTTYFYITESDITLKTSQKLAGPMIKTEYFRYSCKEDYPECRLKPEENQEETENKDSGCSLLFVD